MNIEDEVLNLKEQIKKDKEFFWNHSEKGLCHRKRCDRCVDQRLSGQAGSIGKDNL